MFPVCMGDTLEVTGDGELSGFVLGTPIDAFVTFTLAVEPDRIEAQFTGGDFPVSVFINGSGLPVNACSVAGALRSAANPSGAINALRVVEVVVEFNNQVFRRVISI
ncbi:hypothetical protein [Candidatus Pristimantibacillus sp. PTI5]|uniref:hypothetical protein n=1 Tax=Candidatus Pristimantibacillus sp. PTI5 TaxID=3400422 RepID=UPI003B027464